MLDVMEGFCNRGGESCAYLAFINGEAAGDGVVGAHKGVAGLFGASTLPAFRSRGVQSALLDARLAWASAHGCDLAVSLTQPGSISHRNIERRGFPRRRIPARIQLDLGQIRNRIREANRQCCVERLD
jgi:GNAT superfamily N-acetyltransferase